MATSIKNTPPGGIQETIGAYDSCSVNMSITERAGAFSISLPMRYDDDISKFVVGSDVQITQNGHAFRGWVIKPPIKRNGSVKTITLEGADYTAKTQKIVVTEAYTEMLVSDIVIDLMTKYVPWATRTKISANDRLLTINYPDVYLWDVMEQLCNLTGFDWFIDSSLDINFFQGAYNLNPNIINIGSYKRGTANFTPDTSKLVNRLLVKGGKTESLIFTQNITISDTTPIPLFYTPKVGTISVTIGGVPKTVGIQNIDKSGTKNFLVNIEEKLLIPDTTTSGSGTIDYKYEYPIKILLEDDISQSMYGLFEDILTVEANDKQLAKEVGLRYLEKYSKPVIIGSIEPTQGIYYCGELIKVELPELNIDEYLVIKSVSYESVPGAGIVNIKLSLENTVSDLSTILKDMSKRLQKIETILFGDSVNSIVEKYKVYYDNVFYPKLSDEPINVILHDYLMAGMPMAGGFYV